MLEALDGIEVTVGVIGQWAQGSSRRHICATRSSFFSREAR